MRRYHTCEAPATKIYVLLVFLFCLFFIMFGKCHFALQSVCAIFFLVESVCAIEVSYIIFFLADF